MTNSIFNNTGRIGNLDFAEGGNIIQFFNCEIINSNNNSLRATGKLLKYNS